MVNCELGEVDVVSLVRKLTICDGSAIIATIIGGVNFNLRIVLTSGKSNVVNMGKEKSLALRRSATL